MYQLKSSYTLKGARPAKYLLIQQTPDIVKIQLHSVVVVEVDITTENANPKSIFASAVPSQAGSKAQTGKPTIELGFTLTCYLKELADYKKIEGLLLDGYITLNSSLFASHNLKDIKIYLGRAKAAAEQIHQTVVKLKTDILLEQEPYIKNNQIHGMTMSWNIYSSTSNKATIFTPKIFHKAITIAKFEISIAVKLHTDKHPITVISA
ncbi:hypothetical protein AVEN_18031-1 [Araneus ventricosus]|uniref:Uncharacterized protein n=1 Tax=Araneus ventricosus TaxID=182803 RepID=A0A4Y2DFG7_ARAVE|nr:hypothetical protein AVEN_18031-1 [Araneus ventricosus]